MISQNKGRETSMLYEYEERAIAFLDFLGFSNIVSKTVASEEERVQLLSTLHNISTHLTISDEEEEELWQKYEEITGKKIPTAEELINDDNPLLNNPTFIEAVDCFGKEEDTDFSTIDRRVTIFSDSIIISYPINRMYALIFEIQDVARLLSTCGYMIRGGLSFGKLYHRDKIVVGPAMIDAYNLESKLAGTPRIILSKEYINKANEFNDQYKSYIDFIKVVRADKDNFKFIDFTVLSAPGSFDKLGARIEDNLQEIENSLSVLNKTPEQVEKLKDQKNKNLWLKRLIEPLLT
jgi:hypothetical protein